MTKPIQRSAIDGHADEVRHGANNAPAGTTSAGPVEPAGRLDTGLLTIALACLLPTVMTNFDFTMIYIAQPTFMAVFHTTQITAAWTASGYALALAAAMAPSGWAINRFGARRLVVGSVLLFTISSLLCAMAPGITLLIAARVVQGIGSGLLIPTTFTVLIRTAGPNRLGQVMSLESISTLVGPLLGLVLGGWLIDAFGWQWVFLINLPLGVLATVLAAKTLPDDISGQDEPLDLIEVLLLSPGIAALLYGLSELPQYGTVTAPKVFAPATAGIVMLTAFVLHARHQTENPMIDLRLLRQRVVLAANTARFLSAMSFLGTRLIFPLYFQQVLGASPMQAGMLFVPQVISTAVSSPVIGRITDRRGPRDVALVGTVLWVTSVSVFIWAINQPQAHIAVLIAALALTAIGTSCLVIPVSSAGLHKLNDRDTAHGSTLIHINHQVAGAIGLAGSSTLLAGLSESGGVYAYTVVLAILAGICALSLIPATFLPKKTRQR